ncbi:hypothetical protein [Ensifer sp. B1-9]|uniref:hypothetical protein n=1 Tax=Ensifer sp. B1-9 TaxID=3141455 RepID=UPI003D1FA871
MGPITRCEAALRMLMCWSQYPLDARSAESNPIEDDTAVEHWSRRPILAAHKRL